MVLLCCPEQLGKGAIARTGQIWWPVQPSDRVTARLKGSVLDCFIVIWTLRGDCRLSSEMSDRVKWILWSNCPGDGTVNSLDRRNPEKKGHAASCPHHHVMILLWVFC